MQLDHVSLVIVRKKETNDARELTVRESYRITDGPSYVFLNRNLAYEALREPMDPLKLTLGGMRVTSEHPFEWFIVFRKALPPGEYAAWLTYHDPTLAEDIGTRSNTVGFSVASRPRKGQREKTGAPNH